MQSFSHFPAIPPPVRIPLTVMPPTPCAYLPGRMSTSRAFRVEELPGELYEQFMDAGFRRSGTVIYQPICGRCRACMPIRVMVDQFRPSKSQRRCWKRNVNDVEVTAGKPQADDESFELYRRYLEEWHERTDDDADEDADGARANFEAFLYESPVSTTVEFKYRLRGSGKLVAVGICDIGDASLSSVYFYHDPAERQRGLGTFGALCEIEFARKHEIAAYYLGYWIEGCRTMEYKSVFRPYELLDTDGTWRRPNGCECETHE